MEHEARIQKPEARSQKPEARSQKRRDPARRPDRAATGLVLELCLVLGACVAGGAVCCVLFSLLSSLFFCATGLEILAAVEAEARTGEINTTAIRSDPSKSSQLSQSQISQKPEALAALLWRAG